jgi:hypothetical protein
VFFTVTVKEENKRKNVKRENTSLRVELKCSQLTYGRSVMCFRLGPLLRICSSDRRATSIIRSHSRSYNQRAAVRLFLVQSVETNVALGDSPLHDPF